MTIIVYTIQWTGYPRIHTIFVHRILQFSSKTVRFYHKDGRCMNGTFSYSFKFFLNLLIQYDIYAARNISLRVFIKFINNY